MCFSARQFANETKIEQIELKRIKAKGKKRVEGLNEDMINPKQI